MTLSEIRELLAVDGYVVDLATARQILRASQRGMLYWTKRRLTTSDESRLDLRPLKRALDEQPLPNATSRPRKNGVLR